MKRKIILAVCAVTVAVLVAAPINNLCSIKTEAYTSYRQGMTKELLKNTDFKNGVERPWCTVATLPSKAETKVTDEGYKVTVSNVDNSTRETRWEVTTRQRGIKIEAGHRYNVTFTVKADRDCKLYPTIREVGGSYYEVWNNSWMPVVLKAGESKTIKASFEARVSLPKCEFAFDLAGDCAPKDYKQNSGDKYSYIFSHISLTESVFSY